jgi:hypothetical protein
MELMCAGEKERKEQERTFQAQMVANLMNCFPRSTAITVAMVLGTEKPPKRKTKAQLIKDAKRRGRTYADYQRENGC